ncbi:MAG: LPXTG cell wall anchor domain-containing protein, partial [Clostridiales bacterium]|nr:LPXTG cell wall anchor domain-containing protein [Clostridiales bacterium]
YQKVTITEFASGTTYYTYDASGDTYTAVADGTTYDSSEDYYVKDHYVLVETISGADTNVFTFTGLDDGQYKLVETVTPSGYNTMDDLYFKVEATHSEDQSGNAYVTLTVTQTEEDGTGVITTTQPFSVTNETGTIAATIINESGSSLPVTGGIGTTIFYIVGGVLVCGAVILLVTRRRMGAN